MKKVLFIICLFFTAYAQAANDRAFAWEVTSDMATVYLLGSIHFADADFYPLRQEINEAFDRATSLVVELDITRLDPGAYNALLLRDGMYRDGKTVRDDLSEETWKQLKQRLEVLGIDYGTIKNLKPGILVMQLTALQVSRMGFDPSLGIDLHFLREASRQAKDIIELETLEQQMMVFLNVPDGDLLLRESLYSLDESEQMMAELVSAWKEGNDAQMENLLFEEALQDYPAFTEIYEHLIFERNEQMFLKIENMLNQKRAESAVYFVVIGAGHLVGNQGIVKTLKEKGYRVRRL